MKSVVYKYEFEKGSEFSKIDLPLRAKILKIDYQESTDKVCLWAQVESGVKDMAPRYFRVIPTGNEFDSFEHEYLTTMFINKDETIKLFGDVKTSITTFVFHVFEVNRTIVDKNKS